MLDCEKIQFIWNAIILIKNEGPALIYGMTFTPHWHLTATQLRSWHAPGLWRGKETLANPPFNTNFFFLHTNHFYFLMNTIIISSSKQWLHFHMKSQDWEQYSMLLSVLQELFQSTQIWQFLLGRSRLKREDKMRSSFTFIQKLCIWKMLSNRVHFTHGYPWSKQSVVTLSYKHW